MFYNYTGMIVHDNIYTCRPVWAAVVQQIHNIGNIMRYLYSSEILNLNWHLESKLFMEHMMAPEPWSQ